ncbi:MAG TPA: caspase family protein [Thermotogota bacterium]|nr:caspase family protein [Thermotogota bacterium]HQQ66822.1 caspase family protein [Thermotogota bacterium]
MKKTILFALITLVCWALPVAAAVKNTPATRVSFLERVLAIPQERNAMSVEIGFAEGENITVWDGGLCPTIRFRVSRDAYALVFHINANGEMILSYPDPFDDPSLNNLARANEWIELPPAYRMIGDGESGQEFFQIVAFEKNNYLLSANESFRKAMDGVLRQAAEKALLEEYGFYDLSATHSVVKDLQRNSTREWASNIAPFYFDYKPELKTVEIRPDATYQGSWYVDGKRQDAKPATLKLETGRHLLHLYDANGKLLSREIEVKNQNGTQTITVPYGATAAEKEKHLLVCIGIDAYPYLMQLRSCVKDAQDVLDQMKRSAGLRNVKIETRILLDGQATRGNILRTFGEIEEITDKNTSVILYYSGHGAQVPDRNGDEEDGVDEAIAPYDTNAKLDNLILDDELQISFDRIARKSRLLFVMLDSCFSGSANRGTKSATTKASHMNRDILQNEIQSITADIIFMSSSTGGQPSWTNTDAQMRNSLYTHYLLIGLGGAADQNRDGKVSIDELHGYTSARVLEHVKRYELPFDEYEERYQMPLMQSPSGKTIQFGY